MSNKARVLAGDSSTDSASTDSASTDSAPTNNACIDNRLMSQEAVAYIGLGSNLGDSVQYLREALKALAQIASTKLVKASSIYESAPMGGLKQPNYFNAVAKVVTNLSPWDFIRHTQTVEQQCGRKRDEHWAPRTLDLDILLFAELAFEDPLLQIPHPGIYMRNFVLQPLKEIAPELRFPDGSSIAKREQECPPSPISQLVVDEFQPFT